MKFIRMQKKNMGGDEYKLLGFEANQKSEQWIVSRT